MISQVNIDLYVGLGILTIILSSVVAIAFLSSKELRQHPSGLLACLSICEVIMAYHSIIFALGSEEFIKNLRIQTFIVLFTVNDSRSVE